MNGFLAKWFNDNATGPLAPYAATWSGQYVTEKVSGSHHHQIGARHVGGDRTSATRRACRRTRPAPATSRRA